MDFDTYQKEVEKLCVYPRAGSGDLTYPVLGLNGEAGEVAEKLKKAIRDSCGIVHTGEVARELGDVLWYVAACAWELGYNLSDIARINLDKLNSRKDRGTMHGSGDDR
jgi:NTP pyrophosphatase (non-canonical NTP hydrolase)